jgi:hypothetical protein
MKIQDVHNFAMRGCFCLLWVFGVALSVENFMMAEVATSVTERASYGQDFLGSSALAILAGAGFLYLIKTPQQD